MTDSVPSPSDVAAETPENVEASPGARRSVLQLPGESSSSASAAETASSPAEPAVTPRGASGVDSNSVNGNSVNGDSVNSERKPESWSDETVHRLMARLDAMHDEFRSRLEQIETVTNRLASDDEERDEYRTNREALYAQLNASTTSFHFQLLRPLLQRVALLYDLVSDLVAAPAPDRESAQQSLQLILSNLQDTMEVCGLETVAPVPGSPFDRRFHHVVTTDATADPSQHETVSRTVSNGFLYFGQNERTGVLRPSIVRPARVVTWRYEEGAQGAAKSPPASAPTERPVVVAEAAAHTSGPNSIHMDDPLASNPKPEEGTT